MLAPVRHQPPPPWPANTPLGPNAAQILGTEHWSLLAALLADATGFGPQTTTLAWCCCRWCCCWASPPTRGLVQINTEEFQLVLAMNRLRRAYLTIAPQLGGVVHHRPPR